ncbi:hypothetical protein [Mycobacterium asiaticum]|uniref:hypothetical protein n=1 Tax=Mycobacterium asiaticum TaxID=1790 RepID=UPI0007EF005E|nr:hypothetical protein [Mycobacterium asiaticum]OBJ61678.1 hypothetical protein A9W94_12670 [Mycobacterium asiaticum]
MPMFITPKETVPAKAYKIPEDLDDLAKVCCPLGFTLTSKRYMDPSPSAPDHILCAVTLRPTDIPATDQNTLKATEQDCITWDGINFVVKPFADVEAKYDLEEAPPEPDPTPQPDPISQSPPEPEQEPDPQPEPEPEPEVEPEPEPETEPEPVDEGS